MLGILDLERCHLVLKLADAVKYCSLSTGVCKLN